MEDVTTYECMDDGYYLEPIEGRTKNPYSFVDPNRIVNPALKPSVENPGGQVEGGIGFRTRLGLPSAETTKKQCCGWKPVGFSFLLILAVLSLSCNVYHLVVDQEIVGQRGLKMDGLKVQTNLSEPCTGQHNGVRAHVNDPPVAVVETKASAVHGSVARDCGMLAGSGVKKVNTAQAGQPTVMSSVYCDNGWLVILRRQDGSVDFNRVLADYVNGFGDPAGELWLGLDMMTNITTKQTYRLRVQLEYYDNTKALIFYDNFMVESRSTDYKLNISGFCPSSTLEDRLTYSNGMKFSTRDRDRDTSSNNCASVYKGGFWYKNCKHTHPTGVYGQKEDVSQSYSGIFWGDAMNWQKYARRYVMAIRPRAN